MEAREVHGEVPYRWAAPPSPPVVMMGVMPGLKSLMKPTEHQGDADTESEVGPGKDVGNG